jgi:hypothetical protein
MRAAARQRGGSVTVRDQADPSADLAQLAYQRRVPLGVEDHDSDFGWRLALGFGDTVDVVGSRGLQAYHIGGVWLGDDFLHVVRLVGAKVVPHSAIATAA